MPHTNSTTLATPGQRAAFIALPCLLLLTLSMHFGSLERFTDFKWHYVPRAPQDVVNRLIAMHNQWPLLHEPHLLIYLGLPLFPAVALGLHRLSGSIFPRLSAAALALSLYGTVFLGGLFGMWTAFFRGFGDVPPQQAEGAIATWAALTAPQGAFLLTTQLAKLAFIGLGLQGALLLRVPGVPKTSAPLLMLGCALFVRFWDLDNWMLIGAALLLAALLPLALRPALRASTSAASGQSSAGS